MEIQIKQIHDSVDPNRDGLWYVLALYENGKKRILFMDRYRKVCVKYKELLKVN